MNTQEIANQLVSYCRKGDWASAYNNLYAKEIKSIEPYASPVFDKETIGLEAVVIKAQKFDSMIEKLHSIEVSEPLVSGNHIAFTITMDADRKNIGRVVLPELCLYTLSQGKIVKEEFFYD